MPVQSWLLRAPTAALPEPARPGVVHAVVVSLPWPYPTHVRGTRVRASGLPLWVLVAATLPLRVKHKLPAHTARETQAPCTHASVSSPLPRALCAF